MQSAFPGITTTVLGVHTDEVWNIEWSHDGQYLATASRDKTVIIWRQVGVSPRYDFVISLREYSPVVYWTSQYDSDSAQEWTPHFILRDHPCSVGCLAWSKDDSILLTSAESHIKLWNTKVNDADAC
jgi:WD40 repeat protein